MPDTTDSFAAENESGPEAIVLDNAPIADPTGGGDATEVSAAADVELADFAASVRAEIARHDLPTAIGIVVGAASGCWSNLQGAGIFQSEKASALVDVLLEFVTPCACQTTEQRTHRRGDEAFCALAADAAAG